MCCIGASILPLESCYCSRTVRRHGESVGASFPDVFPSMTKFEFRNGCNDYHIIKVKLSKKQNLTKISFF